jgi:putative NIF3 family GTP cyclohydrolase 1 type 2
MKVKEIFDLAIKMGVESDLRGAKRVNDNLNRLKEKFEKLTEEQKKDFDQERLSNPFMDSLIHNDDGREVKKIMVGIDIDTAELLLAKSLGDIDLVIAHHPTGKGLANLDDVMHLQAEVLADYGVPINVAQSVLKVKIDEVSRGISPINHYKAANAAKLLKVNLINVHTPADNLVANFLKNNIEKKEHLLVGEILDDLKQIPEYAEGQKQGAGPRLFAGSPENYCGKVAITEITGGTEGSPKIYEKMSQAGIGTIIGMHMSEEHKKEAEKNHLNAIIAGHISSDSLGVNLFLDELEKQGIEIVPCSGLIRVSRVKKS